MFEPPASFCSRPPNDAQESGDIDTPLDQPEASRLDFLEYVFPNANRKVKVYRILFYTWVFLLALVFFYPLQLGTPILDPAEGEMAATAKLYSGAGWSAERLKDKVVVRDGILQHILLSSSLSIFGCHDWAVRLPNLILCLAGVFVTVSLGKRLFSRQTGIIAGLMFTTMVLPLALAQVATADTLLVPLATLGFLSLWTIFNTHSRWQLWLAAVFLGTILALALFGKGVLVAFSLLATALVYLIVTRARSKENPPSTAQRHRTKAFALLFSVLLSVVWTILFFSTSEYIVPGYTTNYFSAWYETVSVPIWSRGGLSFLVLLGGGLPWIIYLSATLRDSIVKWYYVPSRDPERCYPQLFCWLWLLSGFLAVPTSSAWTLSTIWPLFPPTAILAAVAWSRLFEGSLTQGSKEFFAKLVVPSGYLCPFILPAVMVILLLHYQVYFGLYIWILVSFVTVACCAPLLFWYSRHYRSTFVAGQFAVAAQFLVIITVLMPVVSRHFSAKQLAVYVNQYGENPSEIFLLNDELGSFLFYLDAENTQKIATGDLKIFSFSDTELLEHYRKAGKAPEVGESIRSALAQNPAANQKAIIILPDTDAKKVAKKIGLTHERYILTGNYRVYRLAVRVGHSPKISRKIERFADPLDGSATRLR